jgi:hypothetical protein
MKDAILWYLKALPLHPTGVLRKTIKSFEVQAGYNPN